ncbi:MAG: LuxR C-terminal-related transcriptional regulator [Acidimicrobiales bacterium]
MDGVEAGRGTPGGTSGRPTGPPLALTRFVGRADELARLAAVVTDHRLVTLVGPGGCGKTRLVLEHLLRSGDHDALVVDLGPLADPAGLVPLLLEAAGAPAQAPGDPSDQLVARLDRRRTLVLDTCEHVLDAATEVTAHLLGRLPGLHVLATSREPLGLAGEAVFRVPSLAVPAGDDLDGAADADAVALFVDRARLVRPDFSATTDLPAVVEVCRRLDGLPLALELAAARLDLLGPRQLVDSLDDRFRVLTGGSQVVLPRSRTLAASMAWSYDLLDDDERRALVALSTFRGTFPLTAAVAVAGAAVDEPSAAVVVARLVRKSLVQAEPTDPETMLHLLDTVAAFAAEVGADRGPDVVARARDRHLRWYASEAVRLADDADRGRPDAPLDRLRRLHPDLLGALEHALGEAGDDPTAATAMWQIAGALTFLWTSTGRFAEARSWFERVAAHPIDDESEMVPAWWGAAHVALYGSDLELAARAGAEAEALARRVGDDRHLGRALDTLATLELFADADRAAVLHQEAIDLATSAGDRWCLADALQASAYGDLFTLRLDRAAAKLDRARPAAVELDHPLLVAWDQAGRALLAGLRGDVADTGPHLAGARAALARLGDPNIALYTELAAAVGGALADGPAPWVPPLTAAVAEAEQVGAGVGLPLAVPQLAQLLLSAGDVAEADALLARWRDLLAAILPRSAWRLDLLDAHAATVRQDRGAAEAALHRASTAAGEHTTPAQQAMVQLTTGVVRVAVGDPATAEPHLVDAVGALHDAGLVPALVDALDALATIREQQAATVDAARLAGAAHELRRSRGIVHTELGALLAPRLPSAGDGRSPAEVDAFAAGVAAPDDVVASIGRGRGTRRRPAIGWGSLTPTEARVVDLAAEGCTNAQIAERLFVGTETVKTHLSSAYDKLGVRNRAALAAARHRLADPPSHPAPG